MNKEIQNEQELEEVTKDKNVIVTWIKAQKKQLALIGISIKLCYCLLLKRAYSVNRLVLVHLMPL